MDTEYIVVEHATKEYKETMALDDVTLKLEKNKIYGIIGRNGSRKTMLLKSIAGFIKLTSGRILIDGKEVGKDMEMAQDTGVIIFMN